MQRLIRILVVLLLLSRVASANYVAFFFENDFLGGDTDQWYTDGWRFTYGVDNVGAFFISQNMYTPADISEPIIEPVEGDRRYVGWLNLGYSCWWNELGPGKLYTEASIGLTGPSALGEDIQRGIHDIFGHQDPKGWDTQTADRLAVQTYAKYQLTIVNPGREWAGAEAWIGASAGNVQVAPEVALIAKFGRGIESPISVDNISVKSVKNSLYAYAGAIMRWQVYDYPIEVSDGVQLKNNNLDNVFGVTWETTSGFDVNYQLTIRTTQYIPQPASHKFGSISLRYRF